jgi:hypothetical protein
LSGPLLIALLALLLSACSTGQLVARSSLSIMDSGVAVMNQETDLELAKAAIPANLKLVESLAREIPSDRELRIHAAQGFYGYSFGFVEDESPARASLLYRRGLAHALVALETAGLAGNPLAMPPDELNQKLAKLGRDNVPELFWAASNWAKWVDLNRTDPARIADLGKIESMMQRVMALDETYYYGAPHLFFGVWYGSRPPMLGGNFPLSEKHFSKAREMTQGKLLIVDVLYAQYLAVQQGEQSIFHDKLAAVIAAPPDLLPEMALVNTIAQHKAKNLILKEGTLF